MAEIAGARDKFAQREADLVAECRAAIEKNAADLEVLRAEREGNQAEVDRMLGVMRQLEAKLAETQESRIDLAKQILDAQAEIRRLRTAVAKADNELLRGNALVSRLRAEIE